MKIATYIRVSPRDPAQASSIEAQAHHLDAYAEHQADWRIIERFTETTADITRPALERALRAADSKRFDLLLVYGMDRLTRSSLRFAQIIERLDAAKVLLRSATQPFDTSISEGRMIVRTLAAYSAFERAMTRGPKP